MKIVCESCGAKYSIADERVAGKVFKIRCKRCSEVIVVRGDQPDAAAAAPAAAPVDDQNAIWHVVVDGEQAGPFSVAQLSELIGNARIDWESYVWTEGFDNWLPLRDVPDLVSALSGEPAASEAAPVYRHSATSTLTGQPSMGADPFADADQGGGMFGSAPPSGSHDLFGSTAEPASPFGGGSSAGVVASAPSPRVGAEQSMTGARNENSVLFSLKNLQALATGTPSVSPAPALGSDRGGGFAAGEGSGLIDIRALAAATGMGDSGGGGARDELLTIGSQGGAFGALGSPILAPVSSDDDGNRKTMIWALVAAVGIASVAAVAIVFVLKGSQNAAPAPVAVVQQPVAPPAAVAPTPTAPAAPTEGELAARAAAAASATGDKHEGSSSGGSRRRREASEGRSSSGSSDSPSPGPASEPAPKSPSKPSGPRTLDDLLDDAVTGGRKPSGASSAPAASNLPDTPSRDQVVSAMNAVKPSVQACAKPGESGVATVAVSVAGESGRVTNAQVNGVTGPLGSCVAQAVRKAQFPKFSQKVFKVNFPFKL